MVDKLAIASIAQQYNLNPKKKKAVAWWYFLSGYEVKEVAYLLNINYKTAWRYRESFRERTGV